MNESVLLNRQPFRIASIKKVIPFALSGAPTKLTASQTLDLSAYRFARFLAVGGGGGGSTQSTTYTLGYIAATSGGATTLALQGTTYGSGGGSGASIMLDVDLSLLPSKVLTVVVGTGGASGDPAGSGSATTLSSTVLLMSAGGGGSGSGGISQGGYGGTAALALQYSRAFVGVSMADGVIGHASVYGVRTISPARNNAIPIHSRASGGFGGLGGPSPTAGTDGSLTYWAA